MIRLHLPRDLAERFDVTDTFDLTAGGMEEAVRALEAQHPGLAHWLTEADGSFRQHLAVFVDGVRLQGAEAGHAPLKSGAEVWVLRAVSGG